MCRTVCHATLWLQTFQRDRGLSSQHLPGGSPAKQPGPQQSRGTKDTQPTPPRRHSNTLLNPERFVPGSSAFLKPLCTGEDIHPTRVAQDMLAPSSVAKGGSNHGCESTSTVETTRFVALVARRVLSLPAGVETQLGHTWGERVDASAQLRPGHVGRTGGYVPHAHQAVPRACVCVWGGCFL